MRPLYTSRNSSAVRSKRLLLYTTEVLAGDCLTDFTPTFWSAFFFHVPVVLRPGEKCLKAPVRQGPGHRSKKGWGGHRFTFGKRRIGQTCCARVLRKRTRGCLLMRCQGIKSREINGEGRLMKRRRGSKRFRSELLKNGTV